MDDTKVIKTDYFEGPIEALLHLIEKRKLPISQVSLAAVADSYIDLIRDNGIFNTEYAVHFVQIASTLLLIKSRELLPEIEVTDEESEGIDDLTARLELFKVTQPLQGFVHDNYGRTILYTRPYRRPKLSGFYPPKQSLNIERMSELLVAALHTLPAQVRRKSVKVAKIISIGEMIASIEDDISKRVTSLNTIIGRLKGSEDTKQAENVVVAFLAVLELVRGGTIDVKQSEKFADIHIEKV